jgi:hypothetical protein
MATNTTAQPLRSALPRRIFLCNAVFGSALGVVLLVGSSPIATFLGLDAPVLLFVLGGLLLAFAGILVWIVARQRISRLMLLGMGIIDSACVLGSIVLLLLPGLPFTSGGKWAIAFFALLIADFAGVELYASRQAQ